MERRREIRRLADLVRARVSGSRQALGVRAVGLEIVPEAVLAGDRAADSGEAQVVLLEAVRTALGQGRALKVPVHNLARIRRARPRQGQTRRRAALELHKTQARGRAARAGRVTIKCLAEDRLWAWPA